MSDRPLIEVRVNPFLPEGEAQMVGADGRVVRIVGIEAPPTTTYSNAPPLSVEAVLDDMRAAKAKLDALGPVPVEIATNPGERLDLDDVPSGETVIWAVGLPVRTDPDVPPSEWWVKKSDGSHEAHRGGTVKVQR